MLSKAQRLNKSEISLLSKGKTVFGNNVSMRFVVFGPKTNTFFCKFSVSISKKVLKTAVDRNKLKRKIFNSLKLTDFYKKSLDSKSKTFLFIMFIPKKQCLDIKNPQLIEEINNLFKLAFKTI